MRLGSFKRLFTSDYEAQYQNLVGKLSGSLNGGLEALYDLANKKISLRDNILCTVRDVDVTLDSTGAPVVSTAIGLDATGRVEGISIIRCDNTTNNSIYPTGHPFISFQQTSSSVLINNITGLQAVYNWRLRVIIWQA